MKQIIVASILGLTAASLGAADPKEKVQNAAKQLTGKSFTWNQTTKNEGGGGGAFGGGPVEGKINKEGVAYVVAKFTVQGEERTFESASKGDKVVRKNQDGEWQAAGAGRGGGGGGGGGGGRGFGRGMMGGGNPMALAQVEALLGRIKELKAGEGGLYSGDLTEDGAKAMVFPFGGGRRGGGGGGGGGFTPPEVSGAKGWVKFWVKDGALSKIQHNVQGKFTFNDQEREVNRTTTIEVKNIGSTEFKLPPEAADALNK